MSAVTTTTTTTMTPAAVVADCELLGRGPVQGSADSDSLAALVRQLCKQQQRARLPGRRCAVSCTRDAGLEIVPHHRLHLHHRNKRPDDEGFESDEDLASLGSYEDPAKRTAKNGLGGGGGGLAVASAVAAGVASDSANSSGVSEDSDDADAASLGGQPTAADAAAQTGDGRETHGLSDVAFCHTDAAALPGVAVWVIKTRRAPHAAGLEAIVFRGRDGRLQDVCRAYQEHSRRLKLEPKPWAAQATQASQVALAAQPQQQQQQQQQQHRRRLVTAVGGHGTATPANLAAAAPPPEVNRYNLVQRTDTDGVTHIEVTAGPVVAGGGGGGSDARGSPDFRRAVSSSAAAPSSIISLSTPESPRPSSRDDARRYDDDDGGCGRDGDGDGGTTTTTAAAAAGECPPQRPERRKHKPKTDGDEDGGTEDFRRQQKVVRGQFIRVNVSHHAAAVPEKTEPDREKTVGARREQPAAKPAASDRLWSTADYDRLDGRYEQHHHRSSSRAAAGRTRSRSTGPGRRQQYPLQLTAVQQQHPPPVIAAAAPFSRYQTADHQHQSFGTRFFGKLREITSGGNLHDLQPVTFRRRNSVGESAATANFHQYFGHPHHSRHGHDPTQYQYQHQQHQQYQQQQQQQHQPHNRQQQGKNCGNLKSVIKKNNKSQLYQHAFDEPKKVTFSAYATVQVVD